MNSSIPSLQTFESVNAPTIRHCERSEAIHDFQDCMDCRASLAMTAMACSFAMIKGGTSAISLSLGSSSHGYQARWCELAHWLCRRKVLRYLLHHEHFLPARLL